MMWQYICYVLFFFLSTEAKKPLKLPTAKQKLLVEKMLAKDKKYADHKTNFFIGIQIGPQQFYAISMDKFFSSQIDESEKYNAALNLQKEANDSTAIKNTANSAPSVIPTAAIARILKIQNSMRLNGSEKNVKVDIRSLNMEKFIYSFLTIMNMFTMIEKTYKNNYHFGFGFNFPHSLWHRKDFLTFQIGKILFSTGGLACVASVLFCYFIVGSTKGKHDHSFTCGFFNLGYRYSCRIKRGEFFVSVSYDPFGSLFVFIYDHQEKNSFESTSLLNYVNVNVGYLWLV